MWWTGIIFIRRSAASVLITPASGTSRLLEIIQLSGIIGRQNLFGPSFIVRRDLQLDTADRDAVQPIGLHQMFVHQRAGNAFGAQAPHRDVRGGRQVVACDSYHFHAQTSSGRSAVSRLLNNPLLRRSSEASSSFICWRCIGMLKHAGQLSRITGKRASSEKAASWRSRTYTSGRITRTSPAS